MNESVQLRLAQLLRRAGLRELPPAALIATLGISAALLCWAIWNWWPSSQTTETIYDSATAGVAVGSPASVPATGSAGATTATVVARVVVHVVGCVRHPGVYELPDGSRVIDAVDRAGGTLPEAALASVNMARTIADGEQITIPDEDAAPLAGGGAGVSAMGAGTSGQAVTSPGPVDINRADATQLETLPGVGPATAAKIIAEREANGPFGGVDDLARVSGIGPKKLEQLKDFACVR